MKQKYEKTNLAIIIISIIALVFSAVMIWSWFNKDTLGSTASNEVSMILFISLFLFAGVAVFLTISNEILLRKIKKENKDKKDVKKT
jgi:membrane protein implicated in regulation of membrane protease activity